jgi:spore coat protein U-like protein
MKFIKYTLPLLLLALFSHANAQTHSTTANAKATATLASVCTLGSQNVNFGLISLPVGAQSATSSLTVLCTKGSTYTIGLAYGGVYGQGTIPNGNYWVNEYNGYWNEYNSSGTLLSSVHTGYYSPDTSCNQGNTGNGKSCAVAGNAYGYGVMTGTAKGDTIAYFIQVPNNPSQVWNSGNYSYSSTGTGANQSIPVVATLKPSNTPSSYPTADSYLDTVTATITY